MSLVTLTPLTCNRAATPANYTDGKTAGVSTNTYQFANDGNTRLLADAAAPMVVSVVIVAKADGLAATSKAFTIITGSKTLIMGPFPIGIYGETVTLTVSGNTNIAVVSG